MWSLRVLQKVSEHRVIGAIERFGEIFQLGSGIDGEDFRGILPHSVNEMASHFFGALQELGIVEIRYKSKWLSAYHC